MRRSCWMLSGRPGVRDSGRISGVYVPCTCSRFSFGEHFPLTCECVTGRYHCLLFPGSRLAYNIQEFTSYIAAAPPYITVAAPYITGIASYITGVASDITEATSYFPTGYG